MKDPDRFRAQAACHGAGFPLRPCGLRQRATRTHGRGVFQVPEQPSHRLPEEFGGNEWLVDELYERYQQDKNTVDAKWWPLFESFDAGDGSSANGRPAAAARGTLPPANCPSSAAPAAPAAPRPPPPPPGCRRPPGRRAGRSPPRRQKAPATVARDGAKTPTPAPAPRRSRPSCPRTVKAPTAPEEDVVSVLRGPAKAIATNMVTSLEVPDRHQRPRHPGQAADRQPRGHQLQPGPRPRRQGLLHAPDRLRRHPRAVPVPVDERLLRRGRRQAGGCPARARELRHRHRHAQARRHPPAHGAEHQEGGDPQLLRVLAHLRGPDQACPQRQADRGRPLRHHRVPDQPRRHRHRALGAPPVQGPGRHHRRRRTGLPGRVPGRQREDHRAERDQQGPHADLHLRPPRHPGCRQRRVPASSCTSCCSARRTSTTRSSSPCASRTSPCAGAPTCRWTRPTRSTRSPGSSS